jgi:hypothetical protein
MRAALVVALLSIGLAAPAGAQSLYGPGGLLLHPTANVPPKGQLTPAVLILPQDVPAPFPAPGTHTWFSGSLDYGLSSDLEIGATVLGISDWPVPGPSSGGYAKYRFMREKGMLPAAAVGFTMTGFGGTNTRTAFLAVAKQLLGGKKAAGRSVVLHAGALFSRDREGIGRDNDLQPYAGLEIGLTPRLTLSAEGRPKGTGDLGQPVAVSLAYRYGHGGQLVATWANTGMSDGPRLGVGVGLGIGGRR